MCCSSCFTEANSNSVFVCSSRLVVLASENDVNDMIGTEWDGDNKKECDGDDINDMLDNFSDMEFD